MWPAIGLNALITNDSRIGLALHATTFRQNYNEAVTFIEFMNRGLEGAQCNLQF
jgi:hypothetical protein